MNLTPLWMLAGPVCVIIWTAWLTIGVSHPVVTKAAVREAAPYGFSVGSPMGLVVVTLMTDSLYMALASLGLNFVTMALIMHVIDRPQDESRPPTATHTA